MTHEEKMAIYLEIEHELLLEDAGNYVADFCEENDLDPELFDLEELITTYHDRADAYISFGETWEGVVRDYADDYDLI